MSAPSSGDADIPLEPEPTRAAPDAATVSIQIGSYRLLQRIGEGGMGEVWLAEQQRPVRRQVALKVIKAGMDTRQVIARFEAERQALAMMDHPGIATVFDGGATLEGRPYFAMEYVKGEPITLYCDRHRLSPHERLLLFIQVCEAVQHAHQKGVIHRDLKPSNVLVTILDDHPVPKVIDFGVAKATSQSLTERSLVTELGALIGTPEYMSPEQAEMSGLDVDTRTDVYALGVILYELLTGTLPFDRKMLREAGWDEIRRTIREKDPPPPSARITALGPASTESAQNRHSEPARLASQLRGDLDWITMRALDKDRTRRYATANALAADVRRHLDHEPVTAGPPSTIYRARKFVRRHRVGVSVAAGLLVLLVIFAGTMAVQARRIARERDRANREAETARQVSSFLTGLFEVSRPSEAVANSLTARQILDTGAQRIQQDLKAQPEIQAALIGTMGKAYRSLGLFKQAERLHDQALTLHRQLHGPQSTEAASSLVLLADALERQGKYQDAEQLSRQAIEFFRGHPGSNETALGRALIALAWTLNGQGKAAEAEAAAREARTLYDRVPNASLEEFYACAGILGAVLTAKADWSGAERAFSEQLEYARRDHGPRHPQAILALGNVASIWVQQRNLTKAEAAYREIVMLERQQFGAEHSSLALSLNNLGAVLFFQRKYEDAEVSYREALAINRRVLGESHPSVTMVMGNIGQVLSIQGKYPEAEQVLREALVIERRALGNDHPRVGVKLIFLADSLCRAGKASEAEQAAREALTINRTRLGNDHPRTKEAEGALGCALAARHEFVEAETLMLSYINSLQANVGVEGELTEVMRRVIDMYSAWHKPDKAAEWREKLLKTGAQIP
jgi:serine/threonine protein kinase/tetratricopeptide (TPR) repeat protein